MSDLYYIFQIILGLLLIGLIVIQAKGTGLGRQFSTNNYHAKRGMEKTVFYSTIFAAAAFLLLSIAIAF